jgi:hypothetical protein
VDHPRRPGLHHRTHEIPHLTTAPTGLPQGGSGFGVFAAGLVVQVFLVQVLGEVEDVVGRGQSSPKRRVADSAGYLYREQAAGIAVWEAYRSGHRVPLITTGRPSRGHAGHRFAPSKTCMSGASASGKSLSCSRRPATTGGHARRGRPPPRGPYPSARSAPIVVAARLLATTGPGWMSSHQARTSSTPTRRGPTCAPSRRYGGWAPSGGLFAPSRASPGDPGRRAGSTSRGNGRRVIQLGQSEHRQGELISSR